jgi:AcrR family transcriptional regulator
LTWYDALVIPSFRVASSEPEQPAFGLRERKRTRTRLMIQTEAMRLFELQGYEQTTVEQIAEAAAISPRTFFRYFPTKEDVVLWDEYDPLAAEILASRPADESLADTFRAVIRETLTGLYRQDRERLFARIRLTSTVPELRARMLDERTHGFELMLPALAEARGTQPDALQVRVVGSVMVGAVSIALDRWQESDGERDLLDLIDEALDALAAAMRELSPASP